MTSNAVRVACDSLVALPPATGSGVCLFAKNSDRPAFEPQPLCDVPAGRHPTGAVLRCTYIEIPQVPQTLRVIGSRPFWCWGFEHGVNELGVAIGNHTVFTKDTLEGQGVIGMDLVRLGLERGLNAEHAVEVMTALLRSYGQGGSGYGDKEWAYHNSFLVADPAAAFLLETSDRHWAVRRVADVASLSNHLSIGSDWDALSDGAIEHAMARGWWNEAVEARFDFAAAFRDLSLVPEVVSSARHHRTCHLLAGSTGHVEAAGLRSALRDHYGRVAPNDSLSPADAEYFSVCMHADPVGTTTASVVAELSPAADLPSVYWAGLGSPCVGVFLPLFVDLEVPAVLTHAGAESDDSPWWRFKSLLALVERDWQRQWPRVRDVFDPFEAATAEAIAKLRPSSADERLAFVEYTTQAALRRLDDLLRRLT